MFYMEVFEMITEHDVITVRGLVIQKICFLGFDRWMGSILDFYGSLSLPMIKLNHLIKLKFHSPFMCK